MLRGNLSTRPFYNERAVALLLLALGIVVAAVTLFNVSRLVTLGARHAELKARTESAERRSTELRSSAKTARSSIDTATLDRVVNAAHEANLLIDRRTFSWTELFNRLEATLPTDVRVMGIDPTVRDGQFVVRLGVASRSVDQIDAFIEALEKDGGFRDVLSREEHTNEDDGQIEATLEGVYVPGKDAAAAAPKGGLR